MTAKDIISRITVKEKSFDPMVDIGYLDFWIKIPEIGTFHVQARKLTPSSAVEVLFQDDTMQFFASVKAKIKELIKHEDFSESWK